MMKLAATRTCNRKQQQWREHYVMCHYDANSTLHQSHPLNPSAASNRLKLYQHLGILLILPLHPCIHDEEGCLNCLDTVFNEFTLAWHLDVYKY